VLGVPCALMVGAWEPQPTASATPGLRGPRCEACVAGKFKATNGSDSCTLHAVRARKAPAVCWLGHGHLRSCGANHYSSANRSACLACPFNAVSSEWSSVMEECRWATLAPTAGRAWYMYQVHVPWSIARQCVGSSIGAGDTVYCEDL